MPLFRKIDDYLWELPKTGGMRVPGPLFASEGMLPKLERERVAEQVANVAHLPGIVGASMAMPDAHWGYGFPVGGVAATDAKDGVVSPGGIGYDISCGVRLLRTDLAAAERRTFGTACHGAGRLLSRSAALKQVNGSELKRELTGKGIEVRTASVRGLAEEAPQAYKDVSEVVEVCDRAGLAGKVARLRPMGVVKG